MPVLQADNSADKLSPQARLERILKLQVPVIVKLADRRLSLQEVMRLGPGAIIEFFKPSDQRRVAEAVGKMGVRHAVITMVNRDDMPDGGAAHLAETVIAVRDKTGAAVEVLISDLEGNRDALSMVIASAPEVLGHNVETVPRLYSAVRPVAKYTRSLDILRWASEERTVNMLTKSSIMLGLGETEDEVLSVARDLRDAGVDILTMGQYLAPTGDHHPVRRYYSPDEFADLGTKARALGFHHVEAAPLVRSSYMAHRALHP